MTSKFLTSGSNNLTNGSANLFIAGMTVSGLDPSLPIKTNGVRTLVSAKLDIIDINNLQTELDATISNPLTSDLNANTNNINNINSNEFNKITQPSNASANTLKIYASSATSEIHMVDENGVDSVIGGNVFNQNLNTTNDVEFAKINTKRFDLVDTVPVINFFDENINKKFTMELSNNQLLINNGVAQNQIRIINNNSVTISNNLGVNNTLFVATINELTANVGVSVEGVLMKDNLVDGESIPLLRTDINNNTSTLDNFVNQNVKTTADVQFNSVNLTPWNLKSDNSVLEFRQNGDKLLSLANQNMDRYYFTPGFGANTNYHYGRGSETTPSAVLSGDVLNNQYEWGYYNGTSENIATQVRTRATENFAVNNLGVEMTFATTNNNAGVSRTEKLKLDSNGVTINTGVNSINFPTTRGLVGQVIKQDANGLTSWQNPVGIFSQTNTTTVQNTTVATGVIGTGAGSLTIPGNGFKIGDSFTVKVGGNLTCANSDILTWVIKTVAGVIFSTIVITMSAATNQPFELEIDFTIRTLGVATVASISENGQFTYQQNSQSNYQGGMTNGINNTTFDTTVDNTLSITVEPSNTSIIINTNQCILTRSFP